MGRLLGHGLCWLGLTTRIGTKDKGPWSSQVRCRQAWKTDWTQGWGRGWQPQVIQFFKKIITQINRAKWCSPTITLYSPRGPHLVQSRKIQICLGKRLGSVVGSGTLVMRLEGNRWGVETKPLIP